MSVTEQVCLKTCLSQEFTTSNMGQNRDSCTECIHLQILFTDINMNYITILTPWSRVLLEKLTSKLCRYD